MTSVEIKPCTVGDIPELIAVAVQSYKEHYFYLWYDDGVWYLQNNFTMAQFEKEIADTNVALFLVLNDNAPIGFLKLNMDKAFKNYSESAALELERIYFLKSASGRGFGKRAIAFVMDFAKQKNKSVVWLKTMDSAPALPFYEKQGFEILGNYTLPYEQMKKELRGMFEMAKSVA